MTLSVDLTSDEISTRDGDEPSEHTGTNLTRSLYLPPVELPPALEERYSDIYIYVYYTVLNVYQRTCKKPLMCRTSSASSIIIIKKLSHF